MAEHLHHAGYQTALFTTNPYAGSKSNLDRGVDVLREAAGSDLPSSVQLHDDFWRWREVYPAEPYWVHFQTTDVHWPRPSRSRRSRVLREQLGARRLHFTDDQRRRLAAKAKAMCRDNLKEIADLVTPDTLLRWYRP